MKEFEPTKKLIDGLDLTPTTPDIVIGLEATYYFGYTGCDADDSKPETYLAGDPDFYIPGLDRRVLIDTPTLWSKAYWDDLGNSDPTDAQMQGAFKIKNKLVEKKPWNTFADDAKAYAKNLDGSLQVQFKLPAVMDDDASFDAFDDAVNIGTDVQSNDLAIDTPAGHPTQTMLWNGSGGCYIQLQLALTETVSGDLIVAAFNNHELDKQPGDIPYDG